MNHSVFGRKFQLSSAILVITEQHNRFAHDAGDSLLVFERKVVNESRRKPFQDDRLVF
ncbi:MAG TPA: hypothetical protein VLW83_08155 [Candidatus Acidoferrales bacterium]|nr:hypothetical protein [Candidatus Acidoferrales bacterium]